MFVKTPSIFHSRHQLPQSGVLRILVSRSTVGTDLTKKCEHCQRVHENTNDCTRLKLLRSTLEQLNPLADTVKIIRENQQKVMDGKTLTPKQPDA